jgi:hypothetical protein
MMRSALVRRGALWRIVKIIETLMASREKREDFLRTRKNAKLKSHVQIVKINKRARRLHRLPACHKNSNSRKLMMTLFARGFRVKMS